MCGMRLERKLHIFSRGMGRNATSGPNCEESEFPRTPKNTRGRGRFPNIEFGPIG